MNKYYLFIFMFVQVNAGTNIIKFKHDDKVVDVNSKSVELAKIPMIKIPIGDRVETAQIQPEWRSDNSEYYESAEKDAVDSISDFDDLSGDADSQEGLDDVLDAKDFDRKGNNDDETVPEHVLTPLPRPVNDEPNIKDDYNNVYLDYRRELKLSGRRNMDSDDIVPKVESGAGDVANPIALPNTFPIYRQQYNHFVPLPNTWRMPITLTYPTPRFTSVLNYPYNLDKPPNSPTSSQDVSNNYPYSSYNEFGFHHPFKTRTLF